MDFTVSHRFIFSLRQRNQCNRKRWDLILAQVNFFNEVPCPPALRFTISWRTGGLQYHAYLLYSISSNFPPLKFDLWKQCTIKKSATSDEGYSNPQATALQTAAACKLQNEVTCSDEMHDLERVPALHTSSSV